MESIIKQALNRNQMQEESAISGADETLMSEQKQEAPQFREQPQMVQQQERVVEQPQFVQKPELKNKLL